MTSNLLDIDHNNLVNYVNGLLAPGKIEFRQATTRSEEEIEGSFYPNDGYPSILIFRKNNVDLYNEMIVILHEAGHFISYRDNLTEYNYNSVSNEIYTGSRFNLLNEEITAWSETFKLLNIIEISQETRDYLSKIMPDIMKSCMTGYLLNNVQDSPILGK